MNFFIYKDQAGYWRWNLKAANGLKIADSGEGYVQKSDCIYAIGLVQSSTNAPIYDLTK